MIHIRKRMRANEREKIKAKYDFINKSFAEQEELHFYSKSSVFS